MSVPVFLKSSNPAVDNPSHYCSAALAALLTAARSARYLSSDKRSIQLLTCESWRDIKRGFRAGAERFRPVLIPRILPPLPNYPCFVMSYPPVPKTFWEKQQQKLVWARTTVERPRAQR